MESVWTLLPWLLLCFWSRYLLDFRMAPLESRWNLPPAKAGGDNPKRSDRLCWHRKFRLWCLGLLISFLDCFWNSYLVILFFVLFLLGLFGFRAFLWLVALGLLLFLQDCFILVNFQNSKKSLHFIDHFAQVFQIVRKKNLYFYKWHLSLRRSWKLKNRLNHCLYFLCDFEGYYFYCLLERKNHSLISLNIFQVILNQNLKNLVDFFLKHVWLAEHS